MLNLWSQVKYKAPIDCIIDRNIREYDIAKANISVLLEAHKIDQDEYARLCSMPKLQREIYIGKSILRYPEIGDIIKSGIIEAKRKFFEYNQIQMNEVLRINNDAVCIIGDRLINQQVSDYVYFKLANSSTSFYHINNIDFFYFADIISKIENLVVKGMGNSAVYHEKYMLDFLKTLFCTAQFEGIESALNLLSGFYKMYISRELDIGFYRTLNSESRFIMNISNQYQSYSIDYLFDPRLAKFIDISFNEKILRGFNKLLSIKYFNK